MTRVYEGLWTHRIVSSEPDVHGEALTECGGLVRFGLTHLASRPVTCWACLARVQREGVMMREYAVDNLPETFDSEAGRFRKVALTRAMRIDGPFVVQTAEGPLRCEDGWLAVDARGFPYPIAADEFALIYEEAT